MLYTISIIVYIYYVLGLNPKSESWRRKRSQLNRFKMAVRVRNKKKKSINSGH